MELVRAATLTGYFDVAAQLGLDSLPLLRSADLSRSVVRDQDRMIPARSVVKLLEDSAAAANCASFALRMAELRTVADLGPVSLLIAHQPTLRDAFAVMQRYRNRLNSTLMLQVAEQDGVAIVQEQWALDPPLVSRQSDDLALGVLGGIGAWLLGKTWALEEVHVGHPAPGPADTAVYHRLFAAKVRFGSDFTGLVLTSGMLDAVNPRADPALAAHAKRMADAMLDDAERSLEQEVEEAILLQLPVGGASLNATARALGLHARALQRRLIAAGTSYAAIQDSVRRRQVSRHIANPRLTLTEVAELSGYASLSAFSRWHSQTLGQSPRAARRQLPS